MALEKQASVEIKESFKNIKKIKITDFYESSPGIKNIDFDVVETDGKLIKENSTTIGGFGSYSENGLTLGVTKGAIKVVYTTGKEAIIK
ncbi:hypothetical protein [Latilactobacillus fuchuensis]|uniref:Uncharacterized protein n=1 Tax=Latilactobacillus fuchuensis DSM 14340 = JCM 11249 TaxID=1423747 RepID=A0A0R1RX53_9LACO|nr:hypothetical protein [Latilactobacillus fuchuensis]KRL61409.1 hypothetical protein FC69_GL000814 [Latilactobacillus fuchuensis DSM 14340 = JCM 11249]